jgi:YbbR domain-containing protein
VIPNFFHYIKRGLLRASRNEDNRLYIFAVCLGLASVLWLINSLGKTKEAIVDMPVQYTNLPTNKILISDLPEKLQVRLESDGFTLLRNKMQLAISPINFNVKVFTNDIMSEPGIDAYVLTTRKFIRQISRQISSEITILDIIPDSLNFVFDEIVEEYKPIKHNFELNFINQFYLSDSIRFTPSLVKVRGPKSIIDTLQSVNTKFYRYKKLDTTIETEVGLAEMKYMKITPSKVKATIPVSVFSEYTTSLAISGLNVPDSLHLVAFPGNVTLTCQVALEQYNMLNSSSFILGVDYNDISSGINKLPIRVIHGPSNIRMLSFTPTEVEFILERR